VKIVLLENDVEMVELQSHDFFLLVLFVDQFEHAEGDVDGGVVGDEDAWLVLLSLGLLFRHAEDLLFAAMFIDALLDVVHPLLGGFLRLAVHDLIGSH
jgi:hypothetical protein